MTDRCPFCKGVLAGHPLSVREMMFGTREVFHYARCLTCGALVLVNPPRDLSKYYPSGYYSLGAVDFAADGGWRLSARRVRTDLLLRMPALVVDWLSQRAPLPVFFRWFAGRGLSTQASVLDVGSGSGQTLLALAAHGFTTLLGIDPYLGREVSAGALTLRRCSLDEVAESFDLVMINHTLEHVPDAAATMSLARDRLRESGTLLIRVPLADSWAARHYEADWVQLDAPRHIVVPTEAGIRAAAHAAGLRVVRAFRDGYSLQFWGSEQYRMGIPLRDARSWAESPDSSPFSASQVQAWEEEARLLNTKGDGDSGVFVLERA